MTLKFIEFFVFFSIIQLVNTQNEDHIYNSND